MRILFLYPEIGTTQFGSLSLHMGLASLTAYIKEKGHRSLMLRVASEDREDLLRRVRKYKPDIVGITSGTNQWNYAKQFGQWVKDAIGVPVIYGGWHPTLVPEDAISLPQADYVCVGEGELPLAELLDRLQDGRSVDDVPGIWLRKGDKIIRNPIPPLIEDLDALPFMDLEAQEFGKYPIRMPMIRGFDHTLEINVGRGCPFSCTFCCEKGFRNVYKTAGAGRYVRVRSPRRVIDEIKYHRKKYPFIDSIRFYDGTFVQTKKWLTEFLSLYKREVNLPFWALVRADSMDDETLRMMAEARCALLAYGLETGNEGLRDKILHKGVANEQLRNAFTLTKKHGILVWALIMVGVPFETPENYLETKKMCEDFIDIIDIYSANIFNPYPGSEAIQICEEHGWLTDRMPMYIGTGATIEMPQFPGAEVEQRAQELRQFIIDLICKKKPQGYFDFASSLDSAEKTAPPTSKIHIAQQFADCPEAVWISAHPPSSVKYTNVEVRDGSNLEFITGVSDHVYGLPGGGVEFAAFVDGKRVFKQRLDPKRKQPDQGWFYHSIPLGKYAGKGRTIEFRTSAFGRGGNINCTCGWGRPHLKQRA